MPSSRRVRSLLEWCLSRMPKKKEKGHCYIFVRQDLSIAQQMVQGQHAAMLLGSQLSVEEASSNLVLVGTRDKYNLFEVVDLLGTHRIAHILWFEDDHGTGLTAVATFPLRGKERAPLLVFRLLTL